MAQFEIRRALPQDVQRITEIYNSNTEFLLHHLGRERVDRHFIAREMEEMRCVGFLSCVLVERESGRCVGVLDHGRGKGHWDGLHGCLEETVRGRGSMPLGEAGLPVCSAEALPSGCAGGRRTMSLYGVRRRGLQHTEKYRGNQNPKKIFSGFFLFLRICYFIKNIFTMTKDF